MGSAEVVCGFEKDFGLYCPHLGGVRSRFEESVEEGEPVVVWLPDFVLPVVRKVIQGFHERVDTCFLPGDNERVVTSGFRVDEFLFAHEVDRFLQRAKIVDATECHGDDVSHGASVDPTMDGPVFAHGNEAVVIPDEVDGSYEGVECDSAGT